MVLKKREERKMTWKYIIKKEKPPVKLGATVREKLTPEMERDIEFAVRRLSGDLTMKDVRRKIEDEFEIVLNLFDNLGEEEE